MPGPGPPWSTQVVPAPTVIVLAMPHVFASLIADALRDRGTYDVVVPDLRIEEWHQGTRFDAAITTMPVSSEIADVVIELPDTFERPLRIRTGDVTVEVPVHIDRAVEDAIDALDRIVFGGEDEPVRRARPRA